MDRGQLGCKGWLDPLLIDAGGRRRVVGRWIRFVGGVSYALVLSGFCRPVLLSGFRLALLLAGWGGDEAWNWSLRLEPGRCLTVGLVSVTTTQGGVA
jgi:hypothetical protein